MWTLDISLCAITQNNRLTVVLILLVTVLLYHITKRIREQRAFARIARENNCLPPAQLHTRWPFGIDWLLTMIQQDKTQHIMPLFEQLVEDLAPTFGQKLLGDEGINTVEPKNVEAMLSTQFHNFGFGLRAPTFKPLLGDGIFTQEGAAWKHSREMLRPLFFSSRVDTFSVIREHVESLISLIPEDQVVDFQPLFFRLTLDTSTYLLFGRSVNSLGEQNPQAEAFGEAFRIAQLGLSHRGRLGALYWLIGGKDFRNACKIVHSFVDDVIKDALAAAKSNEASKSEAASDYVFLDALMKETQDPKVLRDQLLNMLLAGRDTTASCLAWTFRLLAQHQTVLVKLREEISTIVGVGPEARRPDRNDLKKMTYLGFVLKEVLRLYPSVPVNSRSALKTTVLPVGGGPDGKSPILVKKGTPVGYSPYVMHRLKKLYGSDANLFRPERWDPYEENEVNLKNIGWGYLPFNGGPRICLGQEFALLEASYVIVRLLQTFRDFDYGSGEEIVEVGKERQDVTLILCSADGCKLQVRKYGL